MEARTSDTAPSTDRVGVARFVGPFGVRFAGLFAGALMTFMGLGAVLPVLPRYVSGPLNGGDVAVGIVMGAFAFTAVVTRPVAGRLTDSQGRRFTVALGALVSALAGALYFVPAGVPGLVGARLVLGVGEALAFTAGLTWTADLAPEDGRGRSLGLFGLSIWTSLSLGPAVGQALLDTGGYAAVWAFCALSPMAGAVVIARLPDSPVSASSDRRGPWLSREAVRPGAALALSAVGFAGLSSYIVLHLAERHVGNGTAVFTAFACAVVAQRLLAGRLPDVIGPRRTAFGAAVAQAVGLAIIAIAHSLEAAIAGALVMGSGFSLLYPSLALMVVESVDEERRGSALGNFTGYFDVGFGLGAPTIGFIVAASTYATGFWVGAGLAVAGALLTGLGGGRHPPLAATRETA